MTTSNDQIKEILCLPRISRRTQELFHLLMGLFRKYVDFDENIFYLISLLYLFLTYFYDIFYSIPYLQIFGREGSGKSRVGDLFTKLASNPFSSGDISDAALFRAIAKERGPTIVVDEADDLSTETRRGVLLRVLKTGYRQNGIVTRCGRGGTIEQFPTFGPKIILNEKGIADRALASRCIVLHIGRSNRRLEQLRPSDDGIDFKEVKKKIRLFADDYRDIVCDRYASFQGIAGIIGRDEEVWGPMVIIADLLADLLDSPLIREEIVKFAKKVVLQREKTQLLGNLPAQILQATQAYVEEPPSTPFDIDGIRFFVGESLCKSIREGWSIPNLKLEVITKVLNHFGIIKEVKRPYLTIKSKGSEVKVQRSCYALDEEKLARLAGHYRGGK
jgi:rRNA processing protein Gar1